MKLLATILMSTCLAVAGAAAAQDAKKDAMAKPMSMQECKDHMDMAKKDSMKKDAAKDKMCMEMMKKDDMMKKDAAMKKDAPKK